MYTKGELHRLDAWASDYPHPDAKILGVVKELEAAVAPLSPEAQLEVLGRSAARFYGL